jgi:hypothetical protein
VKSARSLLWIACVLLLSCRRSDDPVRESLDAMTAAARSRDASAFFERVAADFQGGEGMSRAEAQATLRRYFAAYEILDVTLSDVTIERSEGAALARFTAHLSGQPRKLGGLDALLPSASTYRFEVRFVPENGRWKAAWATWSPAER